MRMRIIKYWIQTTLYRGFYMEGVVIWNGVNGTEILCIWYHLATYTYFGGRGHSELD